MNQQYQQYQRRFSEARGEENGVNLSKFDDCCKNMFNNNTHDCIYGCFRYIPSSNGGNHENGEKTIWPRDIYDDRKMKSEDGGGWLAIDMFTQAIKAVDTVVKRFIFEEFEDLRKEFMATTIKSIMNDEIEIDGCKCGYIVM